MVLLIWYNSVFDIGFQVSFFFIVVLIVSTCVSAINDDYKVCINLVYVVNGVFHATYTTLEEMNLKLWAAL